MKNLIFAASLLVLLSACKDKSSPPPKPTVETPNVETTKLGKVVDAYIQNPSAENAADVDRAFADLDGEIAELDQRIQKVSGEDRSEALKKASNLREYKAKEQVRFTEAKVKAGVKASGEKAKDIGESIKDTTKDAVDAVKDKMP